MLNEALIHNLERIPGIVLPCEMVFKGIKSYVLTQ